MEKGKGQKSTWVVVEAVQDPEAAAATNSNNKQQLWRKKKKL